MIALARQDTSTRKGMDEVIALARLDTSTRKGMNEVIALARQDTSTCRGMDKVIALARKDTSTCKGMDESTDKCTHTYTHIVHTTKQLQYALHCHYLLLAHKVAVTHSTGAYPLIFLSTALGALATYRYIHTSNTRSQHLEH